MSLSQVWASTPRELFDEFAVAQQRREDAADRDIRLAWLMVAIEMKTRADKRLPVLSALTSRQPGPRVQSVSHMRAAMQMIVEAQNAAVRSKRA